MVQGSQSISTRRALAFVQVMRSTMASNRSKKTVAAEKNTLAELIPNWRNWRVNVADNLDPFEFVNNESSLTTQGLSGPTV